MELSGTIPWTISLCLFGLVAAGYFLYRVALPKPIEGIPYNSHAVRRILGDVPDAMKYRADTHEVFGFLEEQLVKHNTPIFQFFMRPFGKPWVVISDFRETQDILSRRTREFVSLRNAQQTCASPLIVCIQDRSDFFGDVSVLSEAAHSLATNTLFLSCSTASYLITKCTCPQAMNGALIAS